MKKGTRGAPLTPLGDKILVKRLSAEEKTKSGIIIPEVSKEAPNIGIVVSTGRGRWDDGMLRAIEVSVGETIAWEQFAGIEIELDNNKYVVISEDEVLGVVNRES